MTPKASIRTAVRSACPDFRLFLGFYLFLALAHWLLPLGWGDDKVFQAVAAGKTLPEFLHGSARLLSDALTYLFSRWHFLWRLSNPLVLTAFGFLLSRTIPYERTPKRTLALLGLSLFPAMAAVDAGFIATTLNYLWPAACALAALLPLRCRLRGQRPPRWGSFLGVLAIPYAVQMQQGGAALFCALAAGSVCCLVRRRRPLFPAVQALLCGAGLLYQYYASTAGAHSRLARETARYFPDFPALGIPQKLELGWYATWQGLAAEFRFAGLAFLAFTVFLAVLAFRRKLALPLRLAALIPPAAAVTAGIWNLLRPFAVHYRMGKAAYTFHPVQDGLFLLLGIGAAGIAAALAQSKPRRREVLAILAAGFGSRMILGFSPTVWASGYRTFFLLFLAMLAVSMMLLETKGGSAHGLDERAAGRD